MSRRNNLPFPRGSTYWEGNSALVSASDATWLEGKTYDTEDNQYGTGSYIRLRVLRSKSATRLIAGEGVRYGTTSGYWGTKIRGRTTVTTDYGIPVDDTYTTSIAQNDLFYAVEEGPCKCLASRGAAGAATASATLTIGKSAVFGASGLLNMAANATAEAHPVGVLGESVTSGVTGQRRALVWVGSLFAEKQ